MRRWAELDRSRPQPVVDGVERFDISLSSLGSCVSNRETCACPAALPPTIQRIAGSRPSRSAAPRRPEDTCCGVRTRRRTGRHASTRSVCFGRCGRSSSASRTSPTSRSRNPRIRQSRPLEQFLAGLRTAWAEGEARPTAKPPAKSKRGRSASRSAGQGHGTVACVVRSRAVEHQPAVARAAPGGASGRVSRRPPAHGAAAGEGLAQGKGDGDGVRRAASRGVRPRREIEPWHRGRVAGLTRHADAGSLKLAGRARRCRSGSYAAVGGWSRIRGGEHFDEETLAKLGSILG